MDILVRNWFLPVGICVGMTVGWPVLGEETTTMLNKALDLVHQVENPAGAAPTDAVRVDLLTQAIQAAQKAPNHRLKGHRVLAIQAIRGAIAQIIASDPKREVATYLKTADAELSASIALAGAADGSPAPVVTSTTTTVVAVTSPAAASSAKSSSTAPVDQAVMAEVITRLVANASKTPPGPVEDDVTAQSVETAKALEADPTFKTGGGIGDFLAPEYNTFILEGPLAVSYEAGAAALAESPVQLTDAALADERARLGTESTTVNGKVVSTTHDSGPGWGDAGGFSFFVGPPIKDAHVVATFCLVRQHGAWKVHGVYLSNEAITGSNRDFIVRELSVFAKKQ